MDSIVVYSILRAKECHRRVRNPLYRHLHWSIHFPLVQVTQDHCPRLELHDLKKFFSDILSKMCVCARARASVCVCVCAYIYIYTRICRYKGSETNYPRAVLNWQHGMSVLIKHARLARRGKWKARRRRGRRPLLNNKEMRWISRLT